MTEFSFCPQKFALSHSVCLRSATNITEALYAHASYITTNLCFSIQKIPENGRHGKFLIHLCDIFLLNYRIFYCNFCGNFRFFIEKKINSCNCVQICEKKSDTHARITQYFTRIENWMWIGRVATDIFWRFSSAGCKVFCIIANYRY